MILSRILYIYSHPVNIQRLRFPPVAAFGPFDCVHDLLSFNFFLVSNTGFGTHPDDPTAEFSLRSLNNSPG